MSELVVRAEPGAPEPSIEGLGRLLVDFERSLTEARPSRVVLADDSDEALAAALVATKLLIEVEVTPEATAGATSNGRLLAQLAAG